MKILVTVGPAPGIINHVLALSLLLAAEGHDIHWLSSPEAKPHIMAMGMEFPITYLESHAIDFNRAAPRRRPHLQQVCDERFLRQTLNDELRLIDALQPELMVTKHYYTIVLASRLTGIPFATYYTDGPAALIAGRHPQASVTTDELTANLNAVARDYGLAPFERSVPYCLESPALNIVRGLPTTALLTSDDLARLPATTAFCGLLTYDGPEEDFDWEALAGLPQPLIYVTFGTVCYDLERYHKTILSLAALQATIVLATMHIDPAVLEPVPPNVLLRRYVPNQGIFRIADLVIHHGGHGTMLGALRAGVPQIIIPDNTVSTSQREHSLMVERLGVGAQLSAADWTPEKLRQLVVHVLTAGHRARARALAPELAHETRQYQAELGLRLRALATRPRGKSDEQTTQEGL